MVIRKEEKMIPNGLLFPSRETAMASKPVLLKTLGWMDAKYPR